MLTANFSATLLTNSSVAFRPPVPHMKTEIKAAYCCVLIILLKNVSAEQVIHIIIYLLLTMQQLVSKVSLFMTDFYIDLFLFDLFSALQCFYYL